MTDNQAVTCLLTKSRLSRREARWVNFPADFDVKFLHKPGKNNVADALSRVPECNISEAMVTDDPEAQSILEQGYKSDKFFSKIISSVCSGSHGGFRNRYAWNRDESRLYLIDDNQQKLCIPKGKLRLQLSQAHHNSSLACHPGRDPTYSRLARYYFGPGMAQQQVRKFVRSCDTCQWTKGDQHRQNLLHPLPVPNQPWEQVGMDFITGLPVTKAILTFVDHLTKTAHDVPTRSTIDASGSAELYIDYVFPQHGLTKVVVCDRDPRLTSEVFRQVFRILGVWLNFSTSNHPQTDGMTERVHRVIGQMLRSTVNHRQIIGMRYY